ncbi:MAG: DUF3817 domain-containing protein [Bacteroidia bacterium]
MLELLKTQLGRLRLIAFAEGVSFLLILFVTMPLKYAFDQPLPNKVIGMIHGVLFVLYIVLVLMVKIERDWSIKTLLLAWAASIIPFGTFWADKKLFRETATAERS